MVARTVLAAGLFGERGARRPARAACTVANPPAQVRRVLLCLDQRGESLPVWRDPAPERAGGIEVSRLRNFQQSNAIRDACHVTIHSDARGLGPNHNDGHSLHAPYDRDHDHDHRAPERYRRRLAQRRAPATTSASPRPAAWALSSMCRELVAAISRKRFIRHFSLGPRLRGAGQCHRAPEFPSKVSLTSVLIAGRAIVIASAWAPRLICRNA